MELTIEEKIRKCVCCQVGVGDSELLNDQPKLEVGFDSLDDIEFIMRLEEEFDIEIADCDAEKLNTVNDCASYVALALSSKIFNGE